MFGCPFIDEIFQIDIVFHQPGKRNCRKQKKITVCFRIDLHIKDLNNALDTGHGLGTPMILTSQVQEMMQWLHNNGCGSDDHSAILKYYERITGVEVRK